MDAAYPDEKLMLAYARGDLRAFDTLYSRSRGMLYRYTPTTIAFQPGENYVYFPSVTEILMSAGFIALAAVGYLFTVKRFAIFPATLDMCTRAQKSALEQRKLAA